jgi:hypothetical protein
MSGALALSPKVMSEAATDLLCDGLLLLLHHAEALDGEPARRRARGVRSVLATTSRPGRRAAALELDLGPLGLPGRHVLSEIWTAKEGSGVGEMEKRPAALGTKAIEGPRWAAAAPNQQAAGRCRSSSLPPDDNLRITLAPLLPSRALVTSNDRWLSVRLQGGSLSLLESGLDAVASPSALLMAVLPLRAARRSVLRGASSRRDG